jgi:hypothetical protein
VEQLLLLKIVDCTQINIPRSSGNFGRMKTIQGDFSAFRSHGSAQFIILQELPQPPRQHDQYVPL